MKLLLLRHPETVANIKGIFNGWKDYPLTEKGKLQMKNIVKELEKIPVDRVFTSPLPRAYNLAKTIAEQKGIKIRVYEELREINFGNFEGKTFQEIEKEFPDECKQWLDNYKTFKFPEGESFEDFNERISYFLKSIEKGANKTYLIVTHLGVIRVILTKIYNWDIDKMWEIQCENGKYIEVNIK
ncbi:hypothetical protein XO10_08115 [Marinitoga sp. 1135]|uniref:alpha-ribazole phosphatase n=1 Tax=unclassified Marinitoga TaxID=2640159 RepID=UPI001586BA14|nr:MULTISPECIES: alpha-ribazole phosphatase [unclassified Marinitoga]NUU96220.1 hypothetical protein [Marinitoga sp. 1135]NUU98143.1 hypothetical protein [Marinitoga sp. 1138]